MYKPVPPRPKKTDITRTRTGCQSCRQRRTKCDEKKPSCGTCARLGRSCEPVPSKIEFRNLTGATGVAQRGKGRISSAATSHPSPPRSGPEIPLNTSEPYREVELFVSPAKTHYNLTSIVTRNPTYPIIFYTDIWRQQCLPALHSALHLLDPIGPFQLTTDMTVALSACRISRTLPQRRIFKLSSTPGLWFRPNAEHESVSHQYYNSAIAKLAQWTQQDFDTNPALGLTILILFCYLESSMGTFREFRLHSKGTKQLIQSYMHSLVSGQGTGLLAAWVEIEMQNWWRRAYFGTPAYYEQPLISSLYPQLEALWDVETPRALLLLILCESHRLNTAAVISTWRGIESHPECTSLLRSQSEKLDQWQAALPTQSLPDDLHDDQTRPIQPLTFSSHYAAMDFAYYVAARVMQCTGPLETLGQVSSVDYAYEETEAWIRILLRIAAGISWEDCVRFNVYSIGFAGLLLACLLRSRDATVGLWMQEWLEARLNEENFEEGNFPVFQILETIRLINRERVEGNDVFALFQTVDDGGGSGKLGSYHSQVITSLTVYGRCRITGTLHSYCRALS